MCLWVSELEGSTLSCYVYGTGCIKSLRPGWFSLGLESGFFLCLLLMLTLHIGGSSFGR